MQCSRSLWRPICRAHNAYNVGQTLAAILVPANISSARLRRGRHASTEAAEYTGVPVSSLSETNTYNVTEPMTEGAIDAKAPLSSLFEWALSERHAVETMFTRHKQMIERVRNEIKNKREYMVELLGEGNVAGLEGHIKHVDQGHRSMFIKIHMRRITLLMERLPPDADLTKLPALRDYINYQGERCMLGRNAQVKYSRSRFAPWYLTPDEAQRTKGQLGILSAEARNFGKYMDLTISEQECRRIVIQEIQDTVSKIVPPEYSTELFGSGRIGLAMPKSDIDIRLFRPAMTMEKRMWRERDQLFSISDHLKNNPDSKFDVGKVVNGRFPLLPLVHKRTKLGVQIVVAKSSADQRKQALKLMRELPNLRYIYFLMSTTLEFRGLKKVFNGGTGSYGLLILLATILRHPKMASFLPRPEHEFKVHHVSEEIGSQVMACLHFIADFPFEQYALSPDLAEPFPKHELSKDEMKAKIEECQKQGDHVQAGMWEIARLRPVTPYLLCLQDPATPTNDLGLRGHAIKHLQATARDIHSNICRQMAAIHKVKRNKFYTGVFHYQPLLKRCVGRADLVMAPLRAEASSYGKRNALSALGQDDLSLFRSPAV